MHRAAKQAGVVAIAGITFAMGLGSAAFAGGPLNLKTSSANAGSFSGSWAWNASGHRGFVVNGSVCDNKNDGDGVYGQGRVDGYGWAAHRGDSNGSSAGCGTENREFYDNDGSAAGQGQYQVCVDDVGSDTCGTSQWYYR